MALSLKDPTLTIEQLVNKDENQFFDRKSGRIEPRDLSKHLSAFANASGGLIVVGIEDNGDITGVTTSQENELRSAAFDYLQRIPIYDLEVVEVTTSSGVAKMIMLFHIATSINEVVKTKNGETYLRVGDKSRRLNADQLVALEYSKGTRSFESEIIRDATMDDLDKDLIHEYVLKLNPKVSSEIDVLKGRGLIKEKDGNILITAAAILLFGKIPTQFLPGARVRFLRYEGVVAAVGANFNVVKDVTIELPLHQLLVETRKLLESQMREFQHLSADGVFVKVSEYPTFAWLEGLVNAVAHRDYSLQGDYIRIAMYDDRIEFSSPGSLPSIVTVDNIQNTRFSRNPMIARVLSDYGWVRELNEGVKRIYTDMQSYFLDPPVFSEPSGNSVLLVLKNNIAARSVRRFETANILGQKWSSLGPLDRNLLVYIANIEKCTPRILIELTGKTRPTIGRHIKYLLSIGVIEEYAASPKDPTKYYTIK